MIRVLVVDDSALMRRALSTMLEEGGRMEVVTARNGEHALEVVDEFQPDVITLDVNMPVMDGLTCLAKIMTTSPRPVVMVSSLTSKGALATLEALELGAVDYVAKPGGTVSLNMSDARDQIVDTVLRAATAKVRRPLGIRGRVRLPYAEPRRPAHPDPGVEPAGAARAASTVDLVVIGASTGGPGVLTDLVGQLPAGFAVPVVIAQHIPARFTGPFARRMDEISAVSVVEVTGMCLLKPGTVYVAHGDADIVVNRRPDGLVVRSVPAGESFRWHPSVNRMVFSALQVCAPERLIGVLLTGMGDDGAEQMSSLKARGGRTLAESEESAVVWGMPGELVKRGGASRVMPADRVVGQLLTWI